MKNSDIARLILFIFLGTSIYLYMGRAFASQSAYIDRHYRKGSYSLWGMINDIEDLLYKSDSSDRIVPLDNVKKKELINLSNKYDSKDFVTDLINAYHKRDLEGFAKHKEAIAQKLRPIWKESIQERMFKEQARKGKEGWIAWVKNNIADTVDRLFRYFFPVAQKK